MPLVSGALEAMKHMPDGFPRYVENAGSLSAAINKFLKKAGLRPTPHHTLYSLRHTFQDRLTTLKVIDRVQCDLMGHKFDRPKYGSGTTLEDKRDALLQIAYKSPGI